MNERVAPLLSFLTLAALAIPPAAGFQDVGGAVLEAPTSAALERALDAISVDHIRADIFFLASDEMRGRDSPSPEQRIAARYLRSRLMRLGFEPGHKESYFHPYTLPQQELDVDACKATLALGGEAVELTIGQDYFIHNSSFHNHEVTGGLVWGGDLSTTDPAGLDLANTWLVGYASEGMSGRRRRDWFGTGIVGLLELPAPNAETPVKDAQKRTFSTMAQPRLRSGRRGSEGQAHVIATERMAKPILDAVGDAAAGLRLDGTFTETCVVNFDDAQMENVCGIWPGTDLKNEVIIISAHYDHVGMQGGEIHNGADDNGSGTTGMLNLAEALSAYGPMRRTVMLIWVSAEEKGLLGSREWTKNPWLPAGMKPVCNINIDMIGRNAPDKLGITPTENHPEYSWLTRVAERNAPMEGFPKLEDADAYYMRSDQANFRANLQIPVAFLFSDVHEDYHMPTDDPEKIDCDKIRRVVRLVMRMLNDLQGLALGE